MFGAAARARDRRHVNFGTQRDDEDESSSARALAINLLAFERSRTLADGEKCVYDRATSRQ